MNKSKMSVTGYIAISGRMDMARIANFTQYHLTASKLAMKAASQIEEEIEIQPQELHQELKEKYIPLCASSITSSVAALESNINEMLYNKKNHINSLPYQQSQKLFMKYEWLKYEWLKNDKSICEQLKFKSSVVPKYNIVSFLLTGEFLGYNKTIQDIEYLVKIRNALIHFTPEREDELAIHKKINRSRQNRFTLSPVYGEGHVLFPHRIVCLDCAKWCNDSALSFISEFNSNHAR